MKLLFDENLSPPLVELLASEFSDSRQIESLEPAFLTPDRSEGVEMAVDTRRAGAPACGSANAVDAARSAAAVDWV